MHSADSYLFINIDYNIIPSSRHFVSTVLSLVVVGLLYWYQVVSFGQLANQSTEVPARIVRFLDLINKICSTTLNNFNATLYKGHKMLCYLHPRIGAIHGETEA